MNKLFAVTVAAAALAVPSLAVAGPAPHEFSRDGKTYVYTSAVAGSRQVIDGYVRETGSRFHLIVRDGRVSGDADGQPVSFRVAAVSPLVETAAR